MDSTRPALEWVKPPRQLRSQKTLERILDAAEALILETGSVAFTVAEVARRGRSSVGSLYARFQGKDALLRSVFERFLEQAEATAVAALAPGRWRGVRMAEILETAVAFAVQVYAERRPLIAALTRSAADDPEMSALAERMGLAAAESLLGLAAERAGEIGHPDPDLAVRFATWTVFSALEAHSLHQASPQPFLQHPNMVAELTRMCCAYLDLGAGAARRAPETATQPS